MQISAFEYTAVFKMPCCALLCHSVASLEKTFYVSLCCMHLQHQPNIGEDRERKPIRRLSFRHWEI